MTSHRMTPTITGLARRLEELSQHHPLDLAEYAALGASAVGSAIAGMYQPALLAVTPLALALGLNIRNRHRIEFETRMQHSATIAELYEMVQSLQASLEELPPEERTRQLEGTVGRQSEAIAEIQEFLEKTSPQNGAMDAATIQKEFAIVRRAITRLRDHTESQLSDLRVNLTKEIESVRSLAIQGGPQPPQMLEAAPASTQVMAEIQKLNQRVTKLQHQNREIVKPNLQRIIGAVKRLERESSKQ